MDPMSKRTGRAIGIVSLSILLQIGGGAQNTTQASEEQSAKSSNSSSSSSNTDLANQLAIVSDSSTNKAKNDVEAETSKRTNLIEPKVDLKAPAVNLNIIPHTSRINESGFTDPSLAILGEPQEFRATAYALNGLTRSGVYVRRGVIAADPRVLPLGSVVEIKAGKYSGVYTVHDTGKSIKGNVVDLWVPSTNEARTFGRRQIKLHVLRFGPKGK